MEYKYFIPATSIEEANCYAKEILDIENADYSGLDLRAANEWNKNLLLVRDRFPEICRGIKLTGSSQYRNRCVYDCLYSDAADKLSAAGYLGFSLHTAADEYAKSIVNAHFAIDPREWASSSFQLNSIIACTNGITLNADRFSATAYENALIDFENQVNGKFHPVGTGTLKGIFDHEFGHQLNGYLDLSSDSVIIRAYKERTQQQLTEELSRYAWDNEAEPPICEFIAEVWSEYCNNPNCRKLAMEIGTRITELYKKKAGV